MSDQADVEALFIKDEEDKSKIEDSKEWKPEEGDVLYGTLLDGKWVTTDHGPTKVLNVEDSDGQVWTVWAGRKLLSDGVDAEAPKIGTTVGIKYGGKREPKKAGGYAFHFYQFHADDHDPEYWQRSKDVLSGKANGPVAATDGLQDPY